MTIRDDAISLRTRSKRLVNATKTRRGLAARHASSLLVITANGAPMDADKRSTSRGYAKSDAIAAADAARPIASLKNNGNICYLNSILYILRFTTRFLHNLHHVTDESAKISLAQDTKAKSNSLGRNAVNSYGSNSSRSNSTKDLLSVGLNDAPRNKVLVLTEKLHEVFVTLHNMEHGSKRTAYDSYLPYPFLQALRETNSIFCSDEQQDAHELLLYLFDNIRDTCNYVEEQVVKYPSIYNDVPHSGGSNSNSSNNKLWNRLTNKTKKAPKETAMICDPPDAFSDSDSEYDDVQANNCRSKRTLRNFLAEDFRGQTVRRTKCLQCENVTQCKEQFYEISVPIRELTIQDRERNPSELYREACLAPETLRGPNKYFCNDCRHLNEAVRSIAFEWLPKIMILQQKRFMHTTEGFDKVNTYMPTPLRLDCFCESCVNRPLHSYKLSGVVMHVGSTMQSGHYKSYVAATERLADYANCTIGKSKPNNEKSAIHFFTAMKSLKDKTTQANDVCPGKSCCSIKMNLNLSALELDGDEVWLECNDDKVRPISVDELCSELAYKTENTNTPYLLFYEKVDRT